MKSILRLKLHYFALFLLSSFNPLNALPQNVSELIITTESKIDICCATLGSQIDQLTNIVETNFAATFTAIYAISGGSCDLSGTYTTLANIYNQDFTTQSKLDLCCSTLNSKVDSLTNIVNADFEGTFTAIAAIPAANFTGTYTLLNTVISQEITTQSKIDLCCATLNSKIDALSGIVVADFASTFTVLANIRQEETTIESKVDALTNIVNTDFAGTFTAIAAISGGSCDLSGTYTVLNALGLCNATPLSLTSTGTTISTPGIYCLTSDVTLGASNTILINTSGVILDLNGHTVSGAASAAAIRIGIVTNPNVSRVSVINGYMANPINSASAGTAIALVGIFAPNNLVFENLNITGFTNALNIPAASNSIVRNVVVYAANSIGISIQGNQNIIENCHVERVSAGSSYTLNGQNVKVTNCTSYLNGSGFSASSVSSIVFDSCTASVHNGAPFSITLSGGGICSLVNCIANDNTGGFSIVGSDSLSQASLVNCQSLRSGSTSPFNIQVSNCILDSCIAQNCIGASGFSLAATPISNCTLRNCVSNFSDFYGFDLLNSTSCTLENCVADKNTLSGFSLNNAAQCLIRNSVASNNSVDGFDGSAAAECCVIQDCTATNNLSFGFTGTDNGNVSFYNNVANCNGTNFDEFSASSAASGMLDSKVDALTFIVNSDFVNTFTALNACCEILNSKIDFCNSVNFIMNSKLDLLLTRTY